MKMPIDSAPKFVVVKAHIKNFSVTYIGIFDTRLAALEAIKADGGPKHKDFMWSVDEVDYFPDV